MKKNYKNYRASFALAAAFILSAFGFVTAHAASATYSGTKSLSLSLSGGFAGTLTSVQGGEVVGPVVVEQNQKKHIAGIKQEPIIIQFRPANVSKEVYTWLADTLAGTARPRDGIISVEGNNHEFSDLSFLHATITEIQFPALDSSSQMPAFISVTIQPEYTRRTSHQGQAVSADPAPPAAVSISIEIPNLKTDRVRNVPALVFKQIPLTPIDPRYEVKYSRVFPNLVLTIPSADVPTYQTWFDDFVLKGNNSDDQEKQGSLRFIDHNGEAFFTLDLNHLGIVGLSPESPLIPQTTAPGYRVEMYCEGMTLNPGPKLASTQPAGSSPANGSQPTSPAASGNVPSKTPAVPGTAIGAPGGTAVGAAPGGTVIGGAPTVPATGTRPTFGPPIGLPNKFDRLPSPGAASPVNTATSLKTPAPPATAPSTVPVPSVKMPAAPATAPSTSPALRSSGVRDRVISPRTSASPAPPQSGNYLVTINALWCGKATLDDPFQFDGKGDEIYCAACVRRYDRKTTQFLGFTFPQTAEYGDHSNPKRIQAGSRSTLGGIQDGDSIPDHASVARLVAAQDNLLPLKLWQGTLTDEADALVISPSIWESDNEQTYFQQWKSKQLQLNDSLFLSSTLQYQIRDRRFGAVELGATESAENHSATELSVLASTIRAALVGLPPIPSFQTGHDGPIGVSYDKSLNEQALPNTTVVLTREIIEAALSGSFQPTVVNPDLSVLINVDKPGILIITFRDRPAGAASGARSVNYSMALQVERVP